MSELIGRIAEIRRFPVKSFQGESVQATVLSESGIYADRVLALRDRDSGKILSGKQGKLGERLLAFEASFEAEPQPGTSLPTVVARVGDLEVRSDDPEAFARACSAALDHPVELVAPSAAPEVYASDWPELDGLALSGASIDFPLPLAAAGSFADLEPLHVLTTASLHQLATLAPDSQIEVSRFRPSLVIDTGDRVGFLENDWNGRSATLGATTLEFGNAAPRCAMTTRAQAGLPRDPNVLRTLVQQNRREFMGLDLPCLGVYAKVSTGGEIRVGDELRID